MRLRPFVRNVLLRVVSEPGDASLVQTGSWTVGLTVGAPGCRLRMVLWAGESPSAESGKRSRYRRNPEVAKDLATLNTLSAHRASLKPLSASGYTSSVLALPEPHCQAARSCTVSRSGSKQV